jgi:anti-sigma regulatory factor (Ser/Thr protein kinase)
VLAAWDCDDPDEVAMLLTSEVVANAVRHAATACAVRVNLEGDLLRVEVADGSPALPRPRRPGPEDLGGWGLLLVESFARQWGAEPTPTGKVVWFTVRVHPRAGARQPERSARR